MAYRIDPEIRIFSVDTGPPASGDAHADRAAARAPSRPESRGPRAAGGARRPYGRAQGPRPIPRIGREPSPLLQRTQGSTADKAPRHSRRLDHGLRRDQWATRTNIRKVEIDHDHGRDREAEPTRRVDEGRGLGLRARRTTCRTTRSTTRVTRRSAAHRARAPSVRARPTAPVAGGGRRTRRRECGIHCSIETGGFEHELHAILGEDADD